MTLNSLRTSGYWVIGGSSVVGTFISKCVVCRKVRRPVSEQKMADLPEDRLEPSPPFTYCAVDIFWPTVDQGRTTRAEEIWRGIHLLGLTCNTSRNSQRPNN